MELQEGQVVEVEYNKEMLVDDIQAQKDEDTELLIQDNLNEQNIDELVEEGAELIDE